MSNIGTNNEYSLHFWVKKTLKGIPSGWRILDAGAGEQRYRKDCSHLTYVAQDFGQYDGAGDGSALQTGKWDQTTLDIVCDIINIPESNASFDVILCTEVFEHLADPLLAIKEFSRLLKSGGKLILTAPFCSLTHFAPYHFASGFNQYWYEKHLPAFGFKILEIEKNGNYFEYLAQEIRRIEWVSQNYTDKRLNRIDRFAINYLLKRLGRLSGADQGSDELLFFGCHVLAEKQ